MEKIQVTKKDDLFLKIVHYFITYEDYKPVILHGISNEMWLENLDSDVKLIRVNSNYIHNEEQLDLDLKKTDFIRNNIKKKTYLIKLKMVNILLDVRDEVNLNTENKFIDTIRINKGTDVKKSTSLLKYFPNIKNNFYSVKDDIQQIVFRDNELNNKTNRNETKIAKAFKINKPVVTYTLIAINILIYLLMLSPKIYTLFINSFASYYMNVQIGEIWRLITCVFLHANISHILFNMIALFMVGPEIEKYYGKVKFLCIYLLSGIIGSLFSCILGSSVSIGASGAIFGLFGSLLYFSLNFRATLDGYLKGALIPLILTNLLIGFIVPSIDIWAHIGGLIGGFLVSMALGYIGTKKKNDHINGTIVTILLIVFLVIMLFIK
ncbi:MAG: rhomboid family intramembrane serine protease [Bacilli bacterium]